MSPEKVIALLNEAAFDADSMDATSALVIFTNGEDLDFMTIGDDPIISQVVEFIKGAADVEECEPMFIHEAPQRLQ